MSLNNLFLDFISHFPLKVKTENCINTDKEIFCERCKNSCPHRAIEFQNNRPVLNTEKCTVCGICFSECPVNVFEIEIDLTEFFTKRNNPLIGCYLSDLELDIKVPCLGLLNEEILAALAIKSGDLYLDTSKCKVCPQKEAYEYIKRYIEGANLLLHYHKVPHKVYEVSEEPQREEDILSELFGEETKKKPSVSKKINVPLWRQLFFESVKTLNGEELCHQPVKEEKLRFARPVIDQNKCQRSNVCSFWCPTRALSSDERGIYFTQILCTDCGLCEKICPNSAITLEKSFIPRRNVMAGKTLIGKGEKKTCKRCGKEFIGSPEEEYCLYCRKDLEMENLIKDFLLGGNDGST
jgi:Fe-S-cluster-containing hydrogenase component 2